MRPPKRLHRMSRWCIARLSSRAVCMIFLTAAFCAAMPVGRSSNATAANVQSLAIVFIVFMVCSFGLDAPLCGAFLGFSMVAFAPSLPHTFSLTHSPSHIHSHFPLSPSLAFSFSASLGRSASGGYACCLSPVFLRGSMWMLIYVSAPYRSLSLRSTSDERSCASARVMLPSRRTCISMAR